MTPEGSYIKQRIELFDYNKNQADNFNSPS